MAIVVKLDLILAAQKMSLKALAIERAHVLERFTFSYRVMAFSTGPVFTHNGITLDQRVGHRL